MGVACRSGTETPYFGRKAENLKKYAWYRENSGGKTHSAVNSLRIVFAFDKSVCTGKIINL